jgi:hypothetical protein
MSFSRTSPVAGSASQAALVKSDQSNDRKHPLHPTLPLPPKRLKATGPFADSDDSDDDVPKVVAPPKRPSLNLQRLKQAIAKNHQDASNALDQRFVRKEALIRQENGASSHVQKRKDHKDQLPETPVTKINKAVVAQPTPISVVNCGITCSQEAGLNRARDTARPVEDMRVAQLKPASSQAWGRKVASVPRAPHLDQEKDEKDGYQSRATRNPTGGALVAGFEPVTKTPENSTASIRFTQLQKTPLHTETKETGANDQLALQPKSAQRPATSPSNAMTKQQISFQKQDAKRPGPPPVAGPVKKQKTGLTPTTSSLTTPITAAVNTPNTLRKNPTSGEQTFITHENTSTAPGQILSLSSPTTSTVNKTQPAVPEGSPLFRNANLNLSKQSPATLRYNSNRAKPAPVIPCSPGQKATTIPPKVSFAHKPTQAKPKVASDTQQPVPFQQSAQITPQGAINTPQESSVIPKNVPAPAVKFVRPSQEQPKSAQSSPVFPKEVIAISQANTRSLKIAKAANSALVVPKASSVVAIEASSIQASVSSSKAKNVAPPEVQPSKAAEVAPRTTLVTQKGSSVNLHPDPSKAAPVNQAGSVSKVVPYVQVNPGSSNAPIITLPTTPVVLERKSTPINEAADPQNPARLSPKKAASATKEALITREAPSLPKAGPITLEKTLTPPEIFQSAREVDLALPKTVTSTSIDSSTAASTPIKESPFLEYTVFQKTYTSTDDESSIPTVQISTHTDIDAANAQAEVLHLAALHQHPLVYDIKFHEWNNKGDPFDCQTYLGTFSPVEYPSRKSYLRIWVERNAASTHTDRLPPRQAHFLAKTVFILRMRKVIDPESEDEDKDKDKDNSDDVPNPIRVYHALPDGYAELYTTLDAANRAARRLQVEISHEKEPANDMQRLWQEKNLRELYDKVYKLEKEGGHWQSRCNEVRLGGDRFELVVEQTRLSGPRNL